MSIATMVSLLAQGFLITLQIFFFTLLGSLPLGLLVAFGRMSRNKILSLVVRLYISVMRGTPLMLQLMVVYFGPAFLGLSINRLAAAIIGMILNYAAYFAEIYRSGIESMPDGQYEAAAVLGYRKGQTFFKIILPQVIKRVLPSITNEIITLVKDTSLAQVISVMEMFTWAKKLVDSQQTIFSLVIAGVFYYVFNLVVAITMERVERGFSYYR